MAIQANGRQTGRTDYETPRGFFDLACRVTGIRPTLDVCAKKETTKCPNWYGPGSTISDAFHALPWGIWPGSRVSLWMNPPFGREIGRWLAAMCDSRFCGATGLVLVPNNSRDTDWWHSYVIGHASVAHDVRGRINYLLDGKPTKQAGINAVVLQYRPGEPPPVPFAGPVIDWRFHLQNMKVMGAAA